MNTFRISLVQGGSAVPLLHGFRGGRDEFGYPLQPWAKLSALTNYMGRWMVAEMVYDPERKEALIEEGQGVWPNAEIDSEAPDEETALLSLGENGTGSVTRVLTEGEWNAWVAELHGDFFYSLLPENLLRKVS